MKTAKRALSLLLSLMLVLGAVAVGGVSVSALDPDAYLKIGNVTAINGGEIEQSSGEGWSITVNGDEATLNLDGFDLTYVGNCIYAQNLDLTITGRASLTSNSSNVISATNVNLKLNGNFTLKSTSQSVLYLSNSDLIIDGGSVSAVRAGNGTAVYVGGVMTVNGGSVYAETHFAYAINAGEDLTVNGGSVYAKTESDYAIVYGGDITLNNGEYFALGSEYGAKEMLIKKPGELAGKGTADWPYMICDYADLKLFASIVNGTDGQTQNRGACAKLMNDIDASGYEDWTPMGSDLSSSYIGIFEGDGHVITGLYYNNPSNKHTGLFGFMGSDGTVRNVGIEDGSITGGMYTGGVVGKNEGTVQNCYNTGSVNSTADNAFVGGIAGSNNGTIQNCHFTGTVSGSRTTGGIAGFNNNGCSIQHCYNAGSVTDDNYAGGLTGDNYGTVRDCYNTGNVTATGDSYAGGVAGNNVGQLINCYNTGSVTGYYNGGIVGKNLEGTTQNCYYDSAVLTGIPASAWPKNYNGALSTAQMTGANALDNMTFAYESGEENPWLTKADEADENGGYYWYYPHLKGFAYDKTSAAEDWPEKVEIAVGLSDGDSCTYDGGEHGVYVTVGDTSVPEGATVTYSQYKYSDENNKWEWEGISVTPTGHGNYKMEISFGEETVTKYFTILDPATDYTASYYKKAREDWSTEPVAPVDAGDYKAAVSFTDTGHDQIEKEFTIEPKAVTITAKNASKTYDGEALTQSAFTSTDLEEGDTHTFTVQMTPGSTITNVGTAENVIATVDGVSVTTGVSVKVGNYIVTTVSGTLKITPAPVTLTANSATETYDGTAHSNNGYEVSGLVGSDAITAVVTGSITYPSESPVPNVIESYRFTTGNPENYTVTTVNGELTMSNASNEITITSASGAWAYDGSAHSDNTVTVTSGSLFEGDELVAEATGSVKNISDTAGGNNPIAEGYKIMHGDKDVTENYVITAVNGTLTVNPAKVTVTITGNSATEDYDGSEKSVTGYTATASNSLYDVENDIEFNGSAVAKRTEPGTENMGLSASQFTNSNPNFNVTFTVEEDGKLTVNPVIKFVNEDGTELQSGAVALGSTPEYTGETPEKAASDGNTYEFAGWSPEITAATENATYTATYKAVPIKIEIGEFEDTTGYKEEQTFTVDTSDLPEGAEVHWFVNGEDVGTGESCTVEDPTDDYTIQAKVIDKDGNIIAESEEQKVEVKNGFFDRLKAFFAELIEKILGKAIADLLSSVC